VFGKLQENYITGLLYMKVFQRQHTKVVSLTMWQLEEGRTLSPAEIENSLQASLTAEM
jgi:hypothetical protein